MTFLFRFILIFIACLGTTLAHSQQISDSLTIISGIKIVGNNVTKEKVILRELHFKKGDTVQLKLLDEIEKDGESSLTNTSLFLSVDIQFMPPSGKYTEVYIILEERWYLWPYPILTLADPNFNTWWQTRDISRTSFGAEIVKQNFRGAREEIGCLLQFGYSKSFAFLYNRPYIGNKQQFGLGFTAGYNQNYEVNYTTEENKRIFYRERNGNSRENIFSSISFHYRPEIKNKYYTSIHYNHVSVLDTISTISNDYLINNETNMQYMSIITGFRHDSRNNIGYPTKGVLTDVSFVKRGLYTFKNTPDLFHFYGYVKHYFQIKNRLYSGYAIKGKYNISGKVPYYLQKGLGYSNMVRGYEYYVMDGQSYFLFKSNLKFQLIKPRYHNFDFLLLGQFKKMSYQAYLNVFFDLGYVQDKYYSDFNALNNSWLPGYGIGIDIATYYEKVIRFEVSMNKMKETGFFIHFTQPI